MKSSCFVHIRLSICHVSVFAGAVKQVDARSGDIVSKENKHYQGCFAHINMELNTNKIVWGNETFLKKPFHYNRQKKNKNPRKQMYTHYF